MQMKKTSYIVLLAAMGLSLTACEEKQDVFEMDTLEGIGMVVRAVSVSDGQTLRPVDYISVDYNNLIGINENLAATLNGDVLQVYVNPENSLQLIIPVDINYNNDYSLIVPDGLVYRQDNSSVTNEGFIINFNTNLGVNSSLVAQELTNKNATAEAKALYREMLDNYGKIMYSGAMGGVGWETDYTDYIAANNGGAGYPKVVGFDYLHLASSPSDWINYGDITPVETIWNAGSIPAITWHWNTPGNPTKNLYPYNPGEDGNIPAEAPVEMPGDWSGNLQLPADFFRFAKVGNTVTVYVSDVADDAQGSFKNGSTWAGLIDEDDTNYEYFYINAIDDEGNVVGYSSKMELTLTPSLLSEIQENGLIISGHDYTLNSVAFDGYVCRADRLSFNNDFSPTEALKEGTPQNEIIEADIEKLAGYMKLLQDANIPVLFRPFHEAAGDYSWGAWFWWGSQGVEATKQLWNYLRNKLEGEYGLNNIIWVWTMQTSDAGAPADPSLIKSAYPGDDMVDIVGVDLYPEDVMTDQTAQFDLVNSVVERRKMVALCEVGNLVDPSLAKLQNALWSYFMNWYDQTSSGYGFNGWNTKPVQIGDVTYPNTWAAVANNPFVVNR